MPRRIKNIAELRHGQRVTSLKPVLHGTVKIQHFQLVKTPSGHKEWVECEPMKRPDVRRDVLLVPLKKSDSFHRDLGHAAYLQDGILVSDGPCKHCQSVGLVRDPKTGEHRECKECFGWLLG